MEWFFANFQVYCKSLFVLGSLGAFAGLSYAINAAESAQSATKVISTISSIWHDGD